MRSLRIMTCGSVDDGKSTLIGRLLYDAKALYDDQLQALQKDSHYKDTLEYAYLLDGLSAEREQGITIDVAYRYFQTDTCTFIVADTPGHAQYTRNMAVGASFAQVAILLIDVTKGVKDQTKRHLRICRMMGIKEYVFVINKMDLVSYTKDSFNAVKEQLIPLVQELNIDKNYSVIPVSAKQGDNLTVYSNNMPWYDGTALLPYLENLVISSSGMDDFVMPIQRVARPNADFRGYQGQIVSGSLQVGDEVTILPSKLEAKINALYNLTDTVQRVKTGDSVTVVLDRDMDISRGDVLTTSQVLATGKDFEAELLWVGEDPLKEGNPYFLKIGTKQTSSTITKVLSEIEIDSGMLISAQKIEKNSLSICHVSCFEPIVFSGFDGLSEMGRFILIDRMNHQTVAVGTIRKSLANARHLFYQKGMINRQARMLQKQQKAMTIWLTGLSGSGKSTLASLLEKELMRYGKHTMLLDGDNIRLGLNKNLGFSHEERFENIRRIAEVSKLMNDAGLITIVSAISPMHLDRQNARQIIGSDNFVEVYVSTPIKECQKRDAKGLYRMAKQGKITNFTGIDAPYEVPQNAQIELNTQGKTVEESLEELLTQITTYLE